MKVSVNVLTKNRSQLLKQALLSIGWQTFTDYEVVVVNDGSTDNTAKVLKDPGIKNFKVITHEHSLGITAGRQEALLASQGEYVAVLDDDDEWLDPNKLQKQVKYLNEHKDYVLVGGGARFKIQNSKFKDKFRAGTDVDIRNSMLFKNNFFTSTVMFRREAAIRVGGFVKAGEDLAEDYDLWLRLGKIGKMHNFHEVFTLYRQPNYNREKLKAFLRKQLVLINKHRKDYPGDFLASLILKVRLIYRFLWRIMLKN